MDINSAHIAVKKLKRLKMTKENENLIPKENNALHDKISDCLFDASMLLFFMSNSINLYSALNKENKNIITFYVATSFCAIGGSLLGSSILIKKFGLYCFPDNLKNKENDDDSELEYDARYRV
jgi:hypothetical protein